MSDDEYYDLDDIFWIEEPEPDAADDLAATANYDAVFWEDPACEVEDYHSDWDDLSDDYYDDDPTIERRKRAANMMNSKATAEGPQITRKRKRNNDTAQNGGTDTGTISSIKPNPASFQSVIWKRPDHEKNPVQILEPGDGEKVALLKNWREVFKNSHPSIGRTRMRQQRVLDFLNSDTPEPPRSGPVNDLLENETNREVSTDRTSGVSSLENLRETDIGSGDTTNTSLEESISPPSAQDPEPPKTRSGTKKKNADSIPALSPAKGQKRKASVSVVISRKPALNESVQENSKEPKPKRLAAKKVGQDTQPAPAPGTARRSARQTKSQK